MEHVSGMKGFDCWNLPRSAESGDLKLWEQLLTSQVDFLKMPVFLFHNHVEAGLQNSPQHSFSWISHPVSPSTHPEMVPATTSSWHVNSGFRL